MKRDDFLKGIIQRDRNVIQKIERVAEARLDISHSAPETRAMYIAVTAYDNAQTALEAALTERADFIADYVDTKTHSPHSSASRDGSTSVASHSEPRCGKENGPVGVGENETLGDPNE